MTNCLNCRIELELIKGKEPKKFCSDRCRKAHKRATSDIIKKLENTPLKDLEGVWIPNWRRNHRYLKEAQAILIKTMAEIEGGLTFQYLGYGYDTNKKPKVY